jgi:hypothetical protein
MFKFIRTKAFPFWFLATLVSIAAAIALWPRCGQAQYPHVGFDEFDSAATIRIELDPMYGGYDFEVTAAGPTRVQRSDPYDPGDGRVMIETEIIQMELTGPSPIGPVSVRESPTIASQGEVQQITPGIDFPAESFFDVFVEIDTPHPPTGLGTLHNQEAIRLEAKIDDLPPLGETYIPPPFDPVVLYNANGDPVGEILHAAHVVGQMPSFSVAPGGPSGLDPATIFDRPTAPGIPPWAIGLVPGFGPPASDDVDGLSYGLDYIYDDTDLRFSVDPATTGAPTPINDVLVESSKDPAEAHGDEFKVSPPLPGGGSNEQVLDEDGIPGFLLAFPLAISDDVDALEERPTSAVDLNGDGVPEFPVYFSLVSGSPSLPWVGATPADILMSVGGAPPVVFIPEAALGLAPGDDIDCFCLFTTGAPGTGTVLFSLAPGSPSLVGGALPGTSPADLFLVTAPGAPLLFAAAPALGLLPASGFPPFDNVNALKCVKPLEPEPEFEPPEIKITDVYVTGPSGGPRRHFWIGNKVTFNIDYKITGGFPGARYKVIGRAFPNYKYCSKRQEKARGVDYVGSGEYTITFRKRVPTCVLPPDYITRTREWVNVKWHIILKTQDGTTLLDRDRKRTLDTYCARWAYRP